MSQRDILEGMSKPRRIKHSFTQSINGTPEQVFPLLCPVRETDWIPGWTTDWVISNSGLAERGCILQTPPRPGAGGAACAQGNTATNVTIAYEFTSLGPLGDTYLEGYTAQWYEEFMKVWERQMNYYLETGELISEPDLQSA